MVYNYNYDLQLFADGASASPQASAGSAWGTPAAASTAGVAGSGEGSTVGAAAETAAPNETETAVEVKYGIQPEKDGGTSEAEKAETKTEAAEKVDKTPSVKMYTVEEFKKGKEDAVKQRFKANDKEKKLLAPVFRYLSEELDCDINDYKTMAEKAEAARKARYQKIGAETGNDPSEVEKNADNRYDAHNYREQLKAIREQGEADRFNTRIDAELKTARERYPDLDYFEEIKNPAFWTLINNGFSVTNAYEAVHATQIHARIRDAAIQEATAKLSNSFAAGAARPNEGGAVSSSASKIITDPSKLTKEQRADVKRRVKRGERIIW